MIKLFRDTDIGGSLSGGPDPIPEDVRKKIEELVEIIPERSAFRPMFTKRDIIEAAEKGYSLSLPTIQAQEERIRVLEEALERIKNYSNAGKTVTSVDSFIAEMCTEALTPKTNKP